MADWILGWRRRASRSRPNNDGVRPYPSTATSAEEVFALRSAHYMNIGGKSAQEDRVVMVDDLNRFIGPLRGVDKSVRRSLYGIFDGRKFSAGLGSK